MEKLGILEFREARRADRLFSNTESPGCPEVPLRVEEQATSD